MSSIVKHKDKKTGIIYCYESTSYWDKELKQPRSRRRLIGKIDPVTGEIVPTGSKGRPQKKTDTVSVQGEAAPAASSQKTVSRILSEKDHEIALLRAENKKLMQEKDDILRRLQDICARFSE